MSEERNQGDYKQTALCEVPSLAVAAHELKAPLALIRQLALVLRDEPDDTLLGDSSVQSMCERLTVTSERSLRLVDMITKHARLETALFELEPLHVGRLCEDVAHELEPLCRATGKKLEVRTPKRTVLAVANRDLLRSILIGLCDNALGIDQSPSVIIGATQRDGRVRLGVRDFGPRLTPRSYQKLKDRLGKESQPIGKRPGSSGLGLYIAGQFATAMRGSLGVVRHQGVGATFFVETQPSAQLSLL